MKFILGIFAIVLISHMALAQDNPDALRLGPSSNRPAALTYSQMWYFNFLDEENNMAGVLGAGLTNPENKFGIGGFTTSFGLLTGVTSNNNTLTIWGPRIPTKNNSAWSVSKTFTPSREAAFANPNIKIYVESKDQYFVTGEISDKNHKLIFALTYTRWDGALGNSWTPWQSQRVPKTLGVLPAWITYSMEMPNARVNGAIQVDDFATHTSKFFDVINAKGYHDGFRGELNFSIFKWDWLDYKQPNLTIQLLHTHGPSFMGDLHLQVQTSEGVKSFTFSRGHAPAQNQVHIHYDKVIKVGKNLSYPSEETIQGRDDEGNLLDLHWTLLNSVPVSYPLPFPFKDPVTYEVTAEISGTFLDHKTGIIYPISGKGWADCSELTEEELRK